MLVKTLKRAGFGFFLGVAIGNLISALSGWPDSIVTGSLLERAGGLSAAVLWQTLLSGVLGAVSFGGVSFYDIESWPLLRIAIVHYLVIEAAYMPIAFALGWVTAAKEALLWALYSAGAYLIIFLIMCAIYRAQVKELNELNAKRKGKTKNIRSEVRYEEME